MHFSIRLFDLFSLDRKHLRGMVINGSVDIGGDVIILYKDNTARSHRCSEYREYGDHVCDDVILVPVKSQQRVRYLTVSAKEFVIVCEVQIFAGKSLYYYYYY